MTQNDVQQILERLTRIEDKQDNTAKDVKEVKTLATKTNGRVTTLEKSRERDKGFLAAVALLMPVATAIISALAVARIG